MQLVDLTEYFIEDVIEQGDEERYHSRHPELFDHYFSCWCHRSLYNKQLSADLIRQNVQRIRLLLPEIEERFAGIGLDTKELSLALIVGQQTSNGHAFEFNGKFIVWLAVETYTSELLARTFIPHEIAHALHFSKRSEYYFRNSSDQYRTSRQLACEGLATLVAQTICQTDVVTALWADYLPRRSTENWLKQCEYRWSDLVAQAISQFHKSTPDNGMFVFRDITDIFESRAGYYLGWRIVRNIQINQDISIENLLHLERSRFEELIYNSLEESAK